MVGAGFSGQFFQDRFLIADIVMKKDMAAERRFWFDPPFHRGQSVLLHKQPDDVWRVDFQLGWNADPDEEKKPENVRRRVQAALGDDVEFELEWVSVYQFACRRIDRFRHGRVLFAGDAAHQVSPFGARGANTGVQDIDNLAWKLAYVLRGLAPESLIDSYHDERAWAADDNLRASTRSTDFITPKSMGSRLYRDAVLGLAKTEAFARPLVNSGRLSIPTPYLQSPLNTPDASPFGGPLRPGSVCADAPVEVGARRGWLLEQLGEGFALLAFGDRPPVDAVRCGDVVAPVLHVGADLVDADGVLGPRYDGQPGTVILIRPDQHVAARWRSFDVASIEVALARALGRAA
jgi:3-(3-hydroxy-phenyl)propionate hydroxylase